MAQAMMARVLIVDERDAVAEAITRALAESSQIDLSERLPATRRNSRECNDQLAATIDNRRIDTVVFAPFSTSRKHGIPDLGHAEALFRCCGRARIERFVLLASAAVWDCTHHNPGLIPESRPLRIRAAGPLAAAWIELERIASTRLADSGAELTILRLSPKPLPDGADYFSRLFSRGLAVSVAGYDPPVQILSPADLAGAVRCAIECSRGGVFNVAPDTVIPLRRALDLAGSGRIPVPYSLQRIARTALSPAGLAHSIGQVNYIRYSFAVSNEKIKRDLGFVPARSSARALLDLKPEAAASEQGVSHIAYDPFGMDESYIAAFGRTLFKFLERYYWRIEVDGIENVPRQGRVMLVGVHRGFMPWDGIMALHLMVQRIGRYPRFLVHPGLLKFPFLFNFVRKLGGVIACRSNADYVLERDGMVGMFPEGVQGAFSLYRDAYRLGKFGRDEFVKSALRNRTPILPFVTVGSAEVFPILKKIEWKWWKRRMEWPCFPITPTFPLVPLPLPSKWHTQFLPLINIQDHYTPEAAGDARVVGAISQEVRTRLEEAMNKMLALRRSLFHGSVFAQAGRDSQPTE
jgi:1-acyl-sn-glycerol-3-phosphate acyltransferase/nucleoside-diphosphate-sugar epimerase